MKTSFVSCPNVRFRYANIHFIFENKVHNFKNNHNAQ